MGGSRSTRPGTATPAPLTTPPATPSKGLKRKGRESGSPPAAQVDAGPSLSSVYAGTPLKKSKVADGVSKGSPAGRTTRSKGIRAEPVKSVTPGTILRLTEIEEQNEADDWDEPTYMRVIRTVGASQMVVVEAQRLTTTRAGRGNFSFEDVPGEDTFAVKLQEYTHDDEKHGGRPDVLAVEASRSIDLFRARKRKGIQSFAIDILWKAKVDFAAAADAVKMMGGGLGWVERQLNCVVMNIIRSPCCTLRRHTLFQSAFDAIDGLHSAGFVHRDVKFDNMVVRRKRDNNGIMQDSDEVLFIDNESIVLHGAEWSHKGHDQSRMDPEHMSLGIVSQWVIDLVWNELRKGKLSMWTELDLGRIEGHVRFATASGTAQVLKSSDYWSLGISIVQSLDPTWTAQVGNLITANHLSWYERALTSLTPPSCLEVQNRMSSLAPIYSGITDRESYFLRLDGSGNRVDESTGRVDESVYGGILKRLLKREEHRGSDPRCNTHSSEFPESVIRCGTSTVAEDTSTSGNLASSAALALSKSFATPSVRAAGTKGRKPQNARTRIPVTVRSCLEEQHLIFRYPEVKLDSNHKHIYMLECGLPGCSTSSSDGPYVTEHKTAMVNHLRATGRGKRCGWFNEGEALPYVGIKIRSSNGQIVGEDWDGKAIA